MKELSGRFVVWSNLPAQMLLESSQGSRYEREPIARNPANGARIGATNECGLQVDACGGAMELLIVLVLYEMDIDQSPSFRSLRRCLESESRDAVHVLVYDNSPMPRWKTSDRAAMEMSYCHDPSNGGLESAYNAALEMAIKRHAKWILLLDQDSDLPVRFVRDVLASISKYGSQDDVAAIVPEVLGQRSSISPKEVHLGYLTDLKDKTPGRREKEITGINSGMAIRASFMNSIGGFNRTYWLDFMDYWIFRTIYRNGAIVVFSGASIKHSLSLEARTVSISRYTNMLNAESTFVLEEGRGIELPLYVVRLFARSLKNVVAGRSMSLGWVTTKAALRFIQRAGQRGYAKHFSGGSRK